MGEMNFLDFKNYVEDYYNENGIDEDNIHEWVDSITPIHFSEISKQFDHFSYTISEEDVGLQMWQVMSRTIYYALYERFVQELHEYSDSIDEEDEEE